MLRWPEASQHPQPPPGPGPACPGHPAVTAGGPTVSSTKPCPRAPTGGKDIGWAPGRGPGPTHHPPGSPSFSSWAAPGAELDGMVGVGDVGLFGGQRWKERDRGARSQGLSSSDAPSAGMALPRASAPTPPTAALPPDPSRPPPHRGCWPGAHLSSPCPPRQTLLGALPADPIPLWVSPPPHGVPASS